MPSDGVRKYHFVEGGVTVLNRLSLMPYIKTDGPVVQDLVGSFVRYRAVAYLVSAVPF